MKMCSKCKIKKRNDSFSVRVNGNIQSWCKLCVAEHTKVYKQNPSVKTRKSLLQKKRLDSLRLKLWDYLKSNPCKCGESDPVVLDFDHKADKLFNISEGIKRGYSWNRLLSEIKKCNVLCANCHRRKTAVQRNFYSRIK